MIELAEIFSKHAPMYLEKYGDKMPKSHLKAIEDIINCRTEKMGGEVYYCNDCDEYHYSYHSCGNRNCNKCQNNLAEKWLKKQNELLLPVPYFMVTFTLHDNLRMIARSNQKLFYKLLFKSSSQSLQKLANDPKYIGGKLGMIGVLHTWARDLSFHPHVHYIVPGGGLFDDGNEWLSSCKKFLVPVKALSKIFKAKLRDAIKKKNIELFNQIPPNTWRVDWVVNSIPVGSGEQAFKYLAQYVYRVAISNNRIIKLEDGKVTFKYKHSNTKQWKYKTIEAEEFIRLFLQHVLLKRFVKIRYYGLFANTNKRKLLKAKELLNADSTDENDNKEANIASKENETRITNCTNCGNPMKLVGMITKYGEWINAPPKIINGTQKIISINKAA